MPCYKNANLIFPAFRAFLEGTESWILSNPRAPNFDDEVLHRELLHWLPQRHLWIATSGSSNTPKWCALSKEALLCSASAVNKSLTSSNKDVWINTLPWFHVGGVGIWCRAHLSGAEVVDAFDPNCKWSAENYIKLIKDRSATLSSLVPAQLFDLVSQQLPCPSSLRALIVGGDRLPEILYHKAKGLGWKILPSYGMSECASQIATATPHQADGIFPPLELLDHVTAKITNEGKIAIHSKALFTGYVIKSSSGWQYEDPKVDGWFVSEDYGSLSGAILKVAGRAASIVKIGGEKVSLTDLEEILTEITLELPEKVDALLQAVDDERLGTVLHLAIARADQSHAENIIGAFNRKVLPFERIRKIVIVDEIARSPLHKPLQKRMEKL